MEQAYEGIETFRKVLTKREESVLGIQYHRLLYPIFRRILLPIAILTLITLALSGCTPVFAQTTTQAPSLIFQLLSFIGVFISSNLIFIGVVCLLAVLGAIINSLAFNIIGGFFISWFVVLIFQEYEVGLFAVYEGKLGWLGWVIMMIAPSIGIGAKEIGISLWRIFFPMSWYKWRTRKLIELQSKLVTLDKWIIAKKGSGSGQVQGVDFYPDYEAGDTILNPEYEEIQSKIKGIRREIEKIQSNPKKPRAPNSDNSTTLRSFNPFAIVLSVVGLGFIREHPVMAIAILGGLGILAIASIRHWFAKHQNSPPHKELEKFYSKIWEEANKQDDFDPQALEACRNQSQAEFPDAVNLPVAEIDEFKNIQSKLRPILDEINELVGDAFLPNPSEFYHVTIFSQGELNPTERRKVHRAIAQTKPFKITFKGITLTRDSLILKGYPDNNEIFELREKLKKEIGQRINPIYPVVHVTLGRFTRPLGTDKYKILKDLVSRDLNTRFASVPCTFASVVDVLNVYELDIRNKGERILFDTGECPCCIGRAIVEGEVDFDEVMETLLKGKILTHVIDYVGRKEIKRRKEGRFELLFNPERARYDQATEKDTPEKKHVHEAFNPNDNFNKIYEEDPHQKLFTFNLNGRNVAINVQKSPHCPYHFLILPEPESNQPQFLTKEAIEIALFILGLSRQNLKVIFNSWAAGASINHLHLQALGWWEEWRGKVPIEDADKEEVATIHGVKISRLVNYPACGIILESGDTAKLTEKTFDFVKILQAKDIPHNLIFMKDKVYVIPRYAQKDGIISTCVAWAEMAGAVVARGKKQYKKATEKDVINEIKSVAIKEDLFNDVLKQYLKDKTLSPNLLDKYECRKEAQTLISFLAQRDKLQPANLIVALGNSRLEVPELAAELYHQGFAKKILVSGGIGHETPFLRRNVRQSGKYSIDNLDNLPEADIFKEILLANGVPEQAIEVERNSTSTKENIINSKKLLEEKGIAHNKVILIQHPALQRRAVATFKRWFGKGTKCISYPPSWQEIWEALETKERYELIDLAVGEPRRFEEYGPQGTDDIINVEVPQNVLDAYRSIIVNSPYVRHQLATEGVEVSDRQARVSAKVLQKLVAHPEARTEDICSELGISKETLLWAYQTIRNSPKLQDTLVHRNKMRGVVDDLLFLLKDRDYLNRYFQGEVVYPLIVEFHPGEWCPNSCVYCYSRHNRECPFEYQDRKYGRKPLTPQQAQELVQEFAKKGTREIWVSGGLEPLAGTGKDVTIAILKTAHKNGLRTRLYTDGHLFDGEVREVALNYCNWVRFSISGVTEKMYAAVQRPIANRYNFKGVVQNIREFMNLKKAQNSKVEIGMSYLIIPDPANYKDLIKAAEFAHKMGFDFFAVRVDMGSVARRFNHEEIAEISKQIEIIRKNGREGRYGRMGLDLRGTRAEELEAKEICPDMQRAKNCYARLMKMVVNPFGVGFVCDYVEHPRNARYEFEVGNFVTEGVEKVIKNSNRMRHEVGSCQECNIDCLIHEQVTNTLMEKFEEDKEFGISMDEQPFRVSGKAKQLKRERALVIGATGFIGSHIVDRLLDNGEEVIALTRNDKEETLFRLKDNLRNKNLRLIYTGDLLTSRGLSDLEDAIIEASVVYHFAAKTSAQVKNIQEAIETFTVNGLLTAIIAELCQKHGKKLIYASSAHIYLKSQHPKDAICSEETSLPVSNQTTQQLKAAFEDFKVYANQYISGKVSQVPEEFVTKYLKRFGSTIQDIETAFPEGIYPLSKILGEYFIKEMKPTGKGIILRFTNVYGPKQKETDVVAIITNRLLKEKPVKATIDTRNFVYIEDVIKAIIAAGKKDFAQNETFIVSSDEKPMSMKELVSKIQNYFPKYKDRDFPVEPFLLTLTAPLFNVEKAKKELGFTITPFMTGLEKTIQFFANKYRDSLKQMINRDTYCEKPSSGNYTALYSFNPFALGLGMVALAWLFEHPIVAVAILGALGVLAVAPMVIKKWGQVHFSKGPFGRPWKVAPTRVWQAVKSLLERGRGFVAAILRQPSKRAELRMSWFAQQEELSEEEIMRIRELAGELRERRVIPQLWAKEESYRRNPEISQLLAWTSLPEQMAREVGRIAKFARMVRRGYERVVVIGEEARLYEEVASAIAGERRGYPEISVLESTHPEAVREKIESEINLEKTLFVVSSAEPIEYLYERLTQFYEARGIPAEEIASQVGKHFVAITETNTRFAEEASKREFLRTFNVPEGIRGSSAIFSEGALFILALAGVNIKGFVESGIEGMEICRQERPEENLAVRLAAFQEAMREAGREIVLVLPEELEGLGEVWQGVISPTGKEGEEIISITEKELTAGGRFGEKPAFIHLNVGATFMTPENAGSMNRTPTLSLLKEAGYPVFEISLRGRESIGSLFYVAGFATALSYLMGMEGFGKPAGGETSLPAEAVVGRGLEKGTIGTEIRMSESLLKHLVRLKALMHKSTKVFVFDLESALHIKTESETTASGMSIEFKVTPNSRELFKFMGEIVEAAKQAQNPYGVKFAFVSNTRNLRKEVIEKMLRDYLVENGLTPDVIGSVLSDGLIIDRETGGIVEASGRISAERVCSYITKLLGRTDSNGIEFNIITADEAAWNRKIDERMMMKVLWMVLEPAKEGQALSTAEGLVVAIEGKASRWLEKFIRSRYPEDEAGRLLSQIEDGKGKIMLPARAVDENYLEGIKTEEKIYKVQA